MKAEQVSDDGAHAAGSRLYVGPRRRRGCPARRAAVWLRLPGGRQRSSVVRPLETAGVRSHAGSEEVRSPRVELRRELVKPSARPTQSGAPWSRRGRPSSARKVRSTPASAPRQQLGRPVLARSLEVASIRAAAIPPAVAQPVSGQRQSSSRRPLMPARDLAGLSPRVIRHLELATNATKAKTCAGEAGGRFAPRAERVCGRRRRDTRATRGAGPRQPWSWDSGLTAAVRETCIRGLFRY